MEDDLLAQEKEITIQLSDEESRNLLSYLRAGSDKMPGSYRWDAEVISKVFEKFEKALEEAN